MKNKTIILSNSADGTHLGGTVSYSASTAISSKYLFGKQTATAGQIALAGNSNTSSGARAVGVISDEAEASGDMVSVSLIGATGSTLKALAGSSIAVGDLVCADDNSKAVAFSSLPSSASYYVYGIAIAPASAGDRVEFIPTPGLIQSK